MYRSRAPYEFSAALKPALSYRAIAAAFCSLTSSSARRQPRPGALDRGLDQRAAQARAPGGGVDVEVLEQAVAAGAPEAVAVAQLGDARRGRAGLGGGQHEVGVGVVEESGDAGAAVGVAGALEAEVVAEREHQPGDSLGFGGLGDPDGGHAVSLE
jgi:hypothetical protein